MVKCGRDHLRLSLTKSNGNRILHRRLRLMKDRMLSTSTNDLCRSLGYTFELTEPDRSRKRAYHKMYIPERNA